MRKVKSFFTLGCFVTILSLTAQNSSQDYFKSGRQEWESGNLKVADSLYTLGLNINPLIGENWFNKARINFQLKNYPEAVKAYLKSDSLGYGKKWVALGLAYSYWSLNEKDKATEWFEKLVSLDPSWIDQIRGDRLKSFIGAENYARIVGEELDDSNTREEKWRHDLALLKRSLFRTHYNITTRTKKEEWDSAYRKIYNRISSASDKAIALDFASFVALAGDGHTNTWPQFRDYGYTMLPILLYPFQDGIYVRAAAEEYAELVGKRVLTLGDMNIDEVFDKASIYVGHDNSMHELLVFPTVVSTVEVLEHIGAIEGLESVPITVESKGEKVNLRLNPIAWDYANLGRKKEAAGWVQMYSQESVPMYLQKPNDYYWSKYLPKHNLLYLQINQIRNKEELTFKDFIGEVFNQIESKNIENLVVDIRLNDGGDTELYKPLIQKLTKSQVNRQGHLFTVIGRMTYSAAMNLTVDLEYWTETTFVGEPTGSSPVFIGENKIFTLPNTGLKVSISDRQHQRGSGSSVDKRVWIAPHIYTPISSDDFAKGNDPSMEKILEVVGVDGE